MVVSDAVRRCRRSVLSSTSDKTKANCRCALTFLGISDKDVKVSIESDTLIIQGERKREEEREEQGWYRSERSYGSFYRAIPLPEGAEADKANARFNNGVLEITMPIPKGQQNVQQIPIASGSQTTQSNQSGQQSTTEKTSRAGGA